MFQLISFVLFLIIFDALLVTPTSARCFNGSKQCPNGIIISYPFWSQQDPEYIRMLRQEYEIGNSSEVYYCGYSGFEINCGDDETAGRMVMNISDHLYYVQNIYSNLNRLRVKDGDVDGQNCPRPKRNNSLESAPMLSYDNKQYLFYNCSSNPPPKSNNYYFQDIPCLNNNSILTDDKYSYAVYLSYGYNDSDLSWFKENCQETVVIPELNGNYSESVKFGFDFRWSVPDECMKCERSRGYCYYNKTAEVYQCDCFWNDNNGPTYDDPLICQQRQEFIYGWQKVLYGVPAALGGLLLSLFLLYIKIFNVLYHLIFSRCRNKTKGPKNVEVLLESYGCFALQRYKYSDIMAMTKSFKHTLGQGGYGCVFKGTLRNDGRLVAVKVLNESKGNGEEFINEVATIGRTNHVNVVSLLGFCIEGNKRALVYEFMPNGSLERFIYNEKKSSTQSTHLGWEKLYQIAIGIAKGLEYLHCGCNTRILHFDIKPHNILLDKDFIPKISDFGLAKLYPTRETIVSMVGARGTMGYIAPEINCRNLGGVSHKSDVYSYGMMVLEMIGGRKNLDLTVENMSGIYFPHWIYNQLKRDSKFEESDIIKFDGAEEILKDVIAKKMIMVALWCIQTHPANRPSITKVVEMLEGSDEELQMPPNPSLDPVSLPSSSSST